jgi:hypothetical protein
MTTRGARIIWDLDDDPKGNVQHIAEHGISKDDVRDALDDPRAIQGVSRTSDYPTTSGETSDGR